MIQDPSNLFLGDFHLYMRSPPPRSRILLYDLSLFWVTSHVSPELLSRAKILIWRNQTLGKYTGLLAKGIGQLWSWAGFMATQILAINFVKSTAIYSVTL